MDLQEAREFTAYTDGLRIYLGDEAEKLDEASLAAVLSHEMMHIALKHNTRTIELARKYKLPQHVFNIVADAIANKYIMETNLKGVIKKLNPVTVDFVERYFDVRDAETKSYEEIIDEIAKKATALQVQVKTSQLVKEDLGAPSRGGEGSEERSEGEGEDKEKEGSKSGGSGEGKEKDKEEGKGGGEDKDKDKGKDEDKGGGEGEVLHEGDEADKDARDSKEVERRVERKVADAYTVAKSVGNVPEGLERLVEEVVKPKIDWRALLREKLRAFLGNSSRPSWAHVSKKHPYVRPGRIYHERRDVVVLLDTSGSISDEELRYFVSEVCAIASQVRARVTVIPFDAQAYEPLKISRPGDAAKIRLMGGGGTMIGPAIEVAKKLLKPNDRIVIFSDFMIYDIREREVEDFLMRNRARIIAVSTKKEPPSYLPNKMTVEVR